MKRTYGFLTSGSWIVDVKASTPQSAYRAAQKKLKKMPKKTKAGQSIRAGKVTRVYHTYGKSGVSGAPKRVK